MNVEEQLSSKYTEYDRAIFPLVSLLAMVILTLNLEYLLEFFHQKTSQNGYILFAMAFLGALVFYVTIEFFMSFETQHVWLANNGLVIAGCEGKQTIPFHLVAKVKESRAFFFRASRVVIDIKEESQPFLPGRVAFLPRFHKERLYIPFARNPVMDQLEEVVEIHAWLQRCKTSQA